MHLSDEPIILGGEDSPTMWLSFWGDYLAALGSFALGYVSYNINKEAIKQNEKILHNNGWEHLVDRYNHLEEFVTNEERIHHPSHLDELLAYHEKDDTSFSLQLANWRKDVNLSSLKIIRYMKDDVQDPKDTEMMEYGLALKKINDKALEIMGVFEKSLAETQKKLKDMQKDMNVIFSNLMSKGFALLRCEKRRLLEEAHRYDIPCGII